MNFDTTAVFNSAFDEELAEATPGAKWQISGRKTVTYPRGEDEGWWRDNGPVMVGRWVDWRNQSPWTVWRAPDGSLGIELELLIEVGGELQKMFIDRVFATGPNNTRPVVVDIKSGRVPESLLQLGVYAAAIETQWPGVKIAGGAYWMARTGAIADGVQSLSMYTDRLVGHYMRQVRKARESEIFPPKVSSFCRSCSVGSFCAINNGEFAYMDPDFELMGRK